MRRTTALAWSVFGVAVLVCVSALVLTQAYVMSGRTEIQIASPTLVLGVLALDVATAFVGALVAIRHPRNPIGWLFLIFADGFPLGVASNIYGALELPGAGIGPLVNALSTALWISAPLYALLAFPDGRLPSRRWRPAGWLVASTAPAAVFATVAPNSVYPALLILLGLAVTVTALVSRFRHARGVMREQLKWPAYSAAAALSCAVAVAIVLAIVGTGRDPANEPLVNILFFALLAALYGIPIAAGVAILRYRLYDIDLLIRRTLVYGTATAVLAATYFVAVLAFEAILRPVTAGSEVSVALSTLAVIGLFAPVRSAIQRFIDRRLYRSRYHAERTLEAFSARLRDEVDLDSVRSDLLATASSAMQPAHASVWLRERAP